VKKSDRLVVQAFLEGLRPLLKGDLPTRAAFVYSLYRDGQNGHMHERDVFALLCAAGHEEEQVCAMRPKAKNIYATLVDKNQASVQRMAEEALTLKPL